MGKEGVRYWAPRTRPDKVDPVNLRFVEAFYWAAMLKSVTRAAEKLFVTQSALSSRIAALEAELGVLLLDRRDKQFRLSTAGARFQRQAERLLNLQREIKAEFGSGAESPMQLRIGVIVIPKTGRRARLQENLGALDHPLNTAQLAELDRLFLPPKGAHALEML